MKPADYQSTAYIPDIDDFAAHYPHYRKFAEGEGRYLFEMLLTPEHLISAKEVTRLGFPAVLAVAEDTYQTALRFATPKDKNYLKQFTGAVICTFMEANGYQKTGKKKSVGHHAFNKGEVYRLKDAAK